MPRSMLIIYSRCRLANGRVCYSATFSCKSETALVKVKNDNMVHLDQGSRVALLLLDMSAAFDTLDHTTLLNRFNKEFRIRGKPLK